MKKLLVALIAALVSQLAWSAGNTNSPAASVVKGQVLETQEASPYTYLRLKTAKGETWAAVNKAAVKTGAEVTIENAMVMRNFESKSLKRTFDTIVFGTLAGSAGAAPASGPSGNALVAWGRPRQDSRRYRQDNRCGCGQGREGRGQRRSDGRRGPLGTPRAEGQAGRDPRQGGEGHPQRDGPELDPSARRIGFGGRQQQ